MVKRFCRLLCVQSKLKQLSLYIKTFSLLNCLMKKIYKSATVTFAYCDTIALIDRIIMQIPLLLLFSISFFFQNINALFLCVSNLNPSTSDNTLSEFLKSCSCVANVEVVNLVYSEDRTISVAQFSLPVGTLWKSMFLLGLIL